MRRGKFHGRPIRWPRPKSHQVREQPEPDPQLDEPPVAESKSLVVTGRPAEAREQDPISGWLLSIIDRLRTTPNGFAVGSGRLAEIHLAYQEGDPNAGIFVRDRDGKEYPLHAFFTEDVEKSPL